MSRKKQTRGACAFCGKEMARGSLVRHLKTCNERQKAIAAANEQKGVRQRLYHLQVQDAWAGDFWLHLEMNGESRLKDLDHYLRSIWLECCGHLSAFFAGPAWSSHELNMGASAKRTFAPGVKLTHIYDFGTSSETVVKVVDERVGNPLTKRPIYLMARNNMPEAECIECGKPAQWLCIQCLYENDVWGALCNKHAKTHPHHDYDDPMPLLNSPRTGLCGYDGPAEPPY